jgi:hypothetical protein
VVKALLPESTPPHAHTEKTAPNFFLNCTKNTELTRTHFARTVTFALQKIAPSGIAPRSGPRHMKSEDWKTYRTRFLVKAKQLSSALSFVDSLGRQHSGRKGDYLVESSDGVISIASRQIFEDIYVAMSLADPNQLERPTPDLSRKRPQPCRDRRGPTPHLGMM